MNAGNSGVMRIGLVALLQQPRGKRRRHDKLTFSAAFTEQDRDNIILLAYTELLGRPPDAEGQRSHGIATTAYSELPFLVRGIGGSPEATSRGTDAADLARLLDGLSRSSRAPELDRAIHVTAASLLKNVPLHQKLATLLYAIELNAIPSPLAVMSADRDSDGNTSRLRLCVCGAAGRTLRVVRSFDGYPVFQTRIERAFEYHEADGVEATTHDELVVEVVELKLSLRLARINDDFCVQLNKFLGPELHAIADPKLQRPAPSINADPPVTEPNEARVLIDPYLRTLFSLHHRFIVADDDYCIQNRDSILAWYVNVWPQHRPAPGHIALSPSQRAHLLSDALDAGTLDYSVNRHIFHYARHHGLLARLFESEEGMEDVYLSFLRSRAYPRLAHLGLVPQHVAARLALPMTLKGLSLNRFWASELAEAAQPRVPGDLSAREVATYCAEKFAYSLINDLYVPLIPPQWFLLTQSHSWVETEYSQYLTDMAVDRRWDIHSLARLQDRHSAVLRFLADRSLHSTNRDDFTQVIARHENSLRAGRSEDAPVSVNLVGHGNQSGLSQNLSMFRAALRRAGMGYWLFEASSQRLKDFYAGSGDAQLSRKMNLLAVNAEQFTLDVNHLPASGSASAVNVGFFLWETTRTPATHRNALSFVDEIWAPTEFVRSVYEEMSEGRVRVVNIRKAIEVPQDVDPYPFHLLGVQPGDFVFLCIGDFDSSIVRKNPLCAVRAFLRAFPRDPDVRLILKIRRIDPDHWSNTESYWERVLAAIGGDPRISILTGDLSKADYFSLVRSANCLVSLHRGEGFGYGPAHAMAYGRPVIVTDFSGTKDYCTPGTSFPIPYRSIPVARGDMNYNEDLGYWAEADVDAAADAMARVRTGGSDVEAIAAAGKARIVSDYSPARFDATLKDRIEFLCR
jgi:glycosyltransferase involved in cell wall biosynthesis